MFRTKTAVDRHVQELLGKIKDENERNLRCYSIAKLYHQVGDYESARRYLYSYIDVKPESAGAHKLLGQILEGLGQKEAAMAQYKESLELDSRQDGLVLRICELLVDTDTSPEVNRIKYWIERAGEKFSNHQIIFQLKEKLIANQSSASGNDFEALIVSEIASRPLDINLRVKLIKYYTNQNRMEDAYKHAVEVENTETHRDSISWYEALCEFLFKYKEGRELKWSFWVLYISALERFAALSLKEHGNPKIKTIQEASQAVINLDQALTEAKRQNYRNNLKFIEQMFEHMWGQLQYHLACLLLRKTKRDQKNWTECGRLCSALMLGAISISPLDPSAPWAMSLKEQCRAQVYLWFKEGSYRCSQAGHVLQDYANDNPRKLLIKIEEFSNGQWREHIYRKIFVDNYAEKLIFTSFFAKSNAPNPPLRLLSSAELKIFDKTAKQVWPASLHHHVWLGIVNKKRQSNDSNDLTPNEYAHVFPELQISVYNLSQAAPDSLGQLDVDAFLNAAVLCSFATVKEQQKSGYLNPDRMPTLPADITNPLCSLAQEKWWSSAYRIYRRQENNNGDGAELRQDLQRGLEVVRCIGNHGLHPSILSHLARIFHHRAKKLKARDCNHHDLGCLELRYELYWTSAVPLLERLLNNQTIRSINNKLFDFQGKELSNLELTNALEEGHLILAQKLLRDNLHEQAIEILKSLRCPEASYLQGEIYKKLADNLLEESNISVNSSIRSQYIAMLNKAKSSYYLTLDRLRSPGTNPNHPLNVDLANRITNIEDALTATGVDSSMRDENNIKDSVQSDDSYSSAHSVTDELAMNNLSISHGTAMLTPQRSHRRTPKQSSTPRPQQMSRIQQEARPSPERLDAQMRQLIQNKDSVIQKMMDEHKVLSDSNKQLFESVDILRKELAELRLQVEKKSVRQSVPRPDDDSSYIYDDMNFTMPVQAAPSQALPQHMSRNTSVPAGAIASRQPYTPMMYPPQPPPLGNFYQGGLPFTDPQTQHLQSFYAPGVYPIPGFFPRPFDPTTMTGMHQMQQGLLNSRLMNQLTDLMSSQQQPTPLMQNTEFTNKSEINLIKDSTSIQLGNVKAPPPPPPPVNVVITSSDTLPANVPTVQPTLSVTIPPHHRNVGNNVNNDFPHNYQISMPTQAMIPTTVNLLPLSTTMTTTIAATVAQQVKNNMKNTSIVSTGSHNSSIETVEIEHDPIPDFMPVIPLPAEVKVTTGEEGEETLFCSRAKLFRFVDKEWKERGVGNVKLLRNKEGKVRLLMRRDQVLKICANHLLTPDMKLTQMPNNDKAWIWVANDFADEQVRLEKLCIRFKLAEEAQLFKESFDKAKDTIVVSPVKTKALEIIEKPLKNDEKSNAADSKPVFGGFSFTSLPIIQPRPTTENIDVKKTEESTKPSPFAGFSFTKNQSTSNVRPLTELFKPAAGSWECSSCYTRNNSDVSNCIACAAPRNQMTTNSVDHIKPPVKTNNQPSLSELFKPASDSWECKACYIRNINTEKYCVACDSPCDPSLPPKQKSIGTAATTSFTFGIPATNAPQDFTFGIPNQLETPVPATFSFGSTGKSFNFQFSSKSPIKSPTDADGNVSEDEVVESEDVYFAPVIPLPEKVHVKTGEEDEEILYTHRAKLFRYDSSTKEWKERGLGDIKLLKHKVSKKLRLVMRRDQTLKLCLNHIVNADLEITSKDDKTWLWNAADYSDGDIEYVQLACRFKTPEIAREFKEAVKSGMSSSEESIKDIQVLYATTVSPEERDAAIKLQLPENFYAYKQKKDCSGCIGCKEPDVPLFDIQSSTTSTKLDETPKTPATVTIAPPKFNSPNTPTTTSLIFGNTNNSSPFNSTATTIFATPIFGGTSDNKTSFVFGTTKSHEDSSTNTIFDKTICSPTDTTKSTFNFGNISTFGFTPNTFKGISQSSPIFGTPTINQTSIFGGNTMKSFNTSPLVAESTKDTTSLPSSNTTTTTNSTNITTTSTSLVSQAPMVFSNSLIFGTKIESTTKTTNHQEQPLFLSKADNITDFSVLAAKGTQPTGFKTDPNFTFAGAGTSVFGGKSSSIKVAPNEPEGVNDNDVEDDNQDYDPHYEPIIPLPDAVEVKTGEEEEEKIFSHRAKLYRYEVETKEWKERGVGDMKLLHHPQHGTYRLLLRREQVHKIVCNFLLTADIEFQPLKSSENAWIWAGMNYVDENLVTEKLAIKFKNQELAKKFKDAIDRAQEELRERKRANEEYGDNFDENYQVEDEDEVEEEDDDEDDDQHSIMFERPAVLSCAESGGWNSLGSGQIKMLYDSDIFGARVVFESTTTGDTLCSTIISIETEMEVNGNDCTWSAIDEACDPPVRRTLKAHFSSENYAQEMMMNFQDGLECARQADIREFS